MSFTSKMIKLSKRLGLRSSDRFVIMCHQRSGSNMFASILQQHPQVDFFGQLFKADPGFRNFVSQYDVPEFRGHLFDDSLKSRERFDYLENHISEQESRNTETFTNTYFEKRDSHTAATCVGIKFHGGTLYRDEIASIFLKGDYKVIIQHRKNLLATAISWYQARELDQWRRLNGEKVKKPDIKMDIGTLRWFIGKTKHDVTLWKRLAAANRINYLELVYEDLTGPDFDFSEVWNFLGVRDIGNIQPNTKKLIKNYDHIINLSSIREALESKENGFL